MNFSTDPEIIDDVITSPNFHISIIDHPMKPFGMRYWRYYNHGSPNKLETYLEKNSPQACSWLRDQEYLVNLRFYETIKMKYGFYNSYGYHSDTGNLTNHLFLLPKIR